MNTTVTCVSAGTEIAARSKAIFAALTLIVSGVDGEAGDVVASACTGVAVGGTSEGVMVGTDVGVGAGGDACPEPAVEAVAVGGAAVSWLDGAAVGWLDGAAVA